MKYAWLVAWREFSESAKAKGFWIGIFTFPVILFLSIQAPIWLEQKATPVRYYVLVDQSSNLAAAVESRLESDYQQKVLDSLKEYARKYAAAFSNSPPGAIPKLASVENFRAAGGKDAYLAKLQPFLKPDAPSFKDPRRVFQLVPLPPGLDSKADLSKLAESLKPYLRDQKQFDFQGQQISLSAAVLIPKDIEAHIIRPAANGGVSKAAGGDSRRNLTGEWSGTLDTGQSKLRLLFKFKAQAEGGWRATVDSLDQGAFDIPVDSVTFEDDTVQLELKSIAGSYVGKLDKTRTEIAGRWTQVQSFPLDLVRSSAAPPASEIATSAADADHATRNTHHDPPPDSQIQFWSANVSDPKLHDEIEAALNAEVRGREYLARGVDASLVKKIEQTRVPFASLSPKKEKGKESLNTADTIKQWAPSGFVYLLWMSIWVVIQMLLTNTIEEKSNRIIEVLLSSVTPGELMIGKLIGIAAIGLTMVGAWMLSLFVVLSWKSGGASSLAGQILTVIKGSNIVFLFSIYFLLGFLLCASFILSIGSVCNTLKEAQSYMGVITMLMMVPLLTMTFIPKDPNGSLARILSWIPIYSPFTMMNRAAADPPLFDLIGTLVMMIATAVIALWMAGKVFRIGILRTGQPPKVLEMLRWAVRKRE
jgi:ABC-type Na+ efflux pump permease subunit